MSVDSRTGPVIDSLDEETYQSWADYCFFVRGREIGEVKRIANATEATNHADWLDAWGLIGEWLDWMFGVERDTSEGGDIE